MADASNPALDNVQLIQALAGLFGYGNAGGTKQTQVTGGGTTTKQTLLSQEAVDALLKQILEGTGGQGGGLASVAASAKAPGLYNSTSQQMLVNDLIARAAANVAAQSAPQVTTTTPQTTTQTVAPNKKLGAEQIAKLALTLAGSKGVQKNAKGAWDWLFGGEGGGAAATGSNISNGAGVGMGSNTSVAGLDVGSSVPSLDVSNFASADLGAQLSITPTDGTAVSDLPVGTTEVGAAAGTLNGLNSSTAVPELSTGTSVQGLNVGGKATTESTFGDMFPESNYSTTPSSSSSSSSSSSGASGSILGAATGALAGYSAGKKNYAEDPDMWSQEDDFGTVHRDYRAEVGGASLGGVMGYYGSGLGSAAAAPVVDAVHPFFEDLTRSTITFGDDVGGVTGAIIMDPIGSVASGAYSENDIAASGLTAALGLPAGDTNLVDKVSGVIDKIFDDDGCFITTAVCSYTGRADDCEELTILRNFRDTWLKENHPEDIIQYYLTAPKIVKAISSSEVAKDIFTSLDQVYISDAVAAIKAGDNELAYTIYKNMYNVAAKISLEV